MRQAPSVARLSDAVLKLHPSILRVFILEERTDRFVIAEEAARASGGWFARDIDQSLASGSLNALQILGGPADLILGVPKLVGVLYSNEAVIFTRVDANRILAICTEPSGFEEALQSVNRALPTLTERPELRHTPATTPKSAGEAAEIARNYVATLIKTPDVSIDEVTLNQTGRIWEIQGLYRSMPFARSRRFQLQLGSENGAIMGFVSPQRPSLAPLVTGITIILGTLFFLAWILFLIR
jgi:hypothetical protein